LLILFPVAGLFGWIILSKNKASREEIDDNMLLPDEEIQRYHGDIESAKFQEE
jgi:hypothetical protein